MGKGVIDLPDVMSEGVAVDSLAKSGHEIAGVDDLLAQMAGEEIDRLLSEADATRDAPPPPPPPPEKPVQKIPQPIDEPPAAALAASPVPPPPIPASAAEVVAAVLEALPTSPAAEELESATTAAERSALDEPVAAALDAAATVSPADVTVDAAVFEAPGGNDQLSADAELSTGEVDSLPLYLKPLVWLNAPLTLLPQSVRELVGKVALLTLFNATAVLIYVVVFRKHR